jgi:hypothetical protein
MTPGDRPAPGRARDHAADPIDEALRQIGADMLDEPVPERLRQILRQARGNSGSEPDPATGPRTRGPEER